MKISKTLSVCALIALSGTSVNAQSIEWLAPVDGNWNNAANWTLGNIPNSSAENAHFSVPGIYTSTISNNFTIRALSITNPNATLAINTGRTLNLQNSSTNDGTIILNTTGGISNANLTFWNNSTLDGSGSLFLNAGTQNNDAQVISTNVTLTHGANHTIHGSGNLIGNMMNQGSIIADQSGATTLQLSGSITQNTTGSIGADSGIITLANGSSIFGGELFTTNLGEINLSSGVASIGNLTNTGHITVHGSGAQLALSASITHDGTITLNSNNQVSNANLRFNSTLTLDGSGIVDMVTSGNLNDAQIFSNGPFVGTFGSSMTVQGSGIISGLNGGSIQNLGVINGNDPSGQALSLAGSHIGNGVYRSDNGILALGNGLVLDGGTFDSSGTGIVDMTSGGIAVLSNITNIGEMGIRGQNGTIELDGLFTNNGNLTINSDGAVFNANLRFASSQTIDGNGTITMVTAGNLNDAQIFSNGPVIGTIGSSMTVQGSGIISGLNGGSIQNLGVINGNAPSGQSLSLAGNHIGNGVYRSDNGILALGNGLVLDGGTFDSSGTGIVDMTSGGTAVLSSITNLGEMGIRGQNGTIELDGLFTNNGNLTINSDGAVFNAHLAFPSSQTIDGNGTITMVTAGNIGDAQIYLTGTTIATFGAGQTIQGSGIIDTNDDGSINNQGIINGTDPTNTLTLQGSFSNGQYRSDNGTLAIGNGMSIDSGTFGTSGTGIIDMIGGGAATISNIINNGDLGIRGQGGTIDIAGPLTNNGNIIVNSDGDVFNAHLRFADSQTIDGTGTITMSTAGNPGDAQLIVSPGFVGTLGSNQTLIGDGLLNGDLHINGTINPDRPSRVFDPSALTLGSSSNTIVDLDGTLPGEFDRFVLGSADTIELGGTITMNLDDGYLPLFGDTWDIIDGGTVIGTFDTENMPDAGLGRIYRVIYESNRVHIVLTCDVDFSGDGVLNFFDVSAFLNLFNSQDVRGDLNNDGNFNFFDISIFLSLFSQSCN